MKTTRWRNEESASETSDSANVENIIDIWHFLFYVSGGFLAGFKSHIQQCMLNGMLHASAAGEQ